MSTKLVEQWQERASQVEKERADIEAELSSLQRQTENLKKDTEKYEDVVKKEGSQLQRQLNDMETRAAQVDKKFKVAYRKRQEGDDLKKQVNDDYEGLAKLVKSLQKQERALDGRQNYDQMLLEESESWHVEEGELRQRIHDLEDELRGLRKRTSEEEMASDAKIAEAERILHDERMQRDPDFHPSADLEFSSRAAAAAAVSSSSATVAYRSNHRPLRSSLKRADSKSAAVSRSRAGSVSVLTTTNNDSSSNNNNNCQYGAASTDDASPEMSTVLTRKGSKKRTIFGEMTNNNN